MPKLMPSSNVAAEIEAIPWTLRLAFPLRCPPLTETEPIPYAVVPPFVPDSGMGRLASPEFIAAAKLKRVLKADFDAAGALAKFAVDVAQNPAISGQVLNCDSRIQ